MNNVIPKINGDIQQTHFLKLPDTFGIYSNENIEGIIEVFAKRMELNVRISQDRDNAFIDININDCLDNEEYTASIQENKIYIEAGDEKGIIWALTTIAELNDGGIIPTCKINDKPRYEHRGILIDCSRHFFEKAEIKKIIEELSKVKINYLHWHLTNDQGWRIESEKYPMLHEQGEGKYYSKADIIEIVDFAKVRGITIIPEIDMPGHTRSIVSAYPQYSCSQKEVKLARYGGIYPVILCPGREETFKFVREVLDEVIPLFPGKYWHIGADEAPKHEWIKCPLCQKRMKEEKLKNEDELQNYFINRIKGMIREKGKIPVAFDDCLVAKKIDRDALIQEWMPTRGNLIVEHASNGGKFIYSDMMDIYYDYPEAMTNMERSYKVRPAINDRDYSDDSAFTGFEACVWTENIETNEDLEKHIFPRIYALAENGWTKEEYKDYEDFNKRLNNRKKSTYVCLGAGDPKGDERKLEAARFIKAMGNRIPEDEKKETVEPDVVDEKFNQLFGAKLLNSHGDARELMSLAATIES